MSESAEQARVVPELEWQKLIGISHIHTELIQSAYFLILGAPNTSRILLNRSEYQIFAHKYGEMTES